MAWKYIYKINVIIIYYSILWNTQSWIYEESSQFGNNPLQNKIRNNAISYFFINTYFNN